MSKANFSLVVVTGTLVPIVFSFAGLANAQSAASSASASASAVGSATPAASTDVRPDLVAPVSTNEPKTTPVSAPNSQNSPSTSPSPAADSNRVTSEDWWTDARPVIEIHGFFRTRGEVFANLSLGRYDDPSPSATYPPQNLFPTPLGDGTPPNGELNQSRLAMCPPGLGLQQNQNATGTNCTENTQISANMRLRLDPEIHISDNLRILTEVDLLDDVVYGSTPDGYVNGTNVRSGYIPMDFFSNSQVPPVAGVNSNSNSIAVKRVWAEYTMPIGQLKFGRMPNHWGLGILNNSGDDIDADYQSTMDRLMFTTYLKSIELYVAAAWDFPYTGMTSTTTTSQQGQAYNLTNFDDVHQFMVQAYRQSSPEAMRRKLALGGVVINGGVYFAYRKQDFANMNCTTATECNELNATSGSQTNYQAGMVRLGAETFTPDAYFQLVTKNFEWEIEGAWIGGTVDNPKGVFNGYYNQTGSYPSDKLYISQGGAATELKYKGLIDDLTLHFAAGFASGDDNVESVIPPTTDGTYGIQPRLTSDRTISTFRFDPSYRVDLVFFRNIMSRVQGAYYVKPGIEYLFVHSVDGEKIGGRFDVLWDRASRPVQWPGNKDDLGVELDASLYYQSRDGSLNDNPNKIGGFFGMAQYGVFFPMGGMGYLSGQQDNTGKPFGTSAAQVFRLFLGAVF